MMSEGAGLRALWDGGWSVGVLAAVSFPVIASPLLAPEVRRAEEIVGVSVVVTYVVVLFAGVLIYLHWRMTGGPSGWLVMGLTALAVQALALAGTIAADPTESRAHPGWILLVQLVVATALWGVVAAARRHELRVDPIVAGAVAGVVVIVVRDLIVAHTQPFHLSSTSLHLLNAVILAVDLAIAVALFRLTIVSHWVGVRLGITAVLLGVGHTTATPLPETLLPSVVAITCNVLGAAVLLTLAIALVRRSWSDNRAALDLLGRQLERVEAGARVEEARLHEIRATIAGLGTASRLIHHESAVSEPRRSQLEDMMDSEIARLQRLMNDDDAARPEPVDLDATIQPIVTRHRTLGYPIRWAPSGQRALARADDVAEVVSVLLENAAKHAPGAGASIVTRQADGVVEIAISDSGPGVDRSMRTKLFEWGERGRASDGSGIGLNVARQLTTDLGGYLRLVDSSGPGATFVLGLPSEEMS